MPIRFRTYNGRRRGYAMTLVCLMILLPWCSMATSGTEFYGSSDDTSNRGQRPQGPGASMEPMTRAGLTWHQVARTQPMEPPPMGT